MLIFLWPWGYNLKNRFKIMIEFEEIYLSKLLAIMETFSPIRLVAKKILRIKKIQWGLNFVSSFKVTWRESGVLIIL